MSQSFRGVWGMPPPRKISKISCCEIVSMVVSEPSVCRPKKRCHSCGNKWLTMSTRSGAMVRLAFVSFESDSVCLTINSPKHRDLVSQSIYSCSRVYLGFLRWTVPFSLRSSATSGHTEASRRSTPNGTKQQGMVEHS